MPQLPLLRWVLVPWGLLFASGTVAIAIFGDPADPGSRVVPPFFGAFMLWAAWSWWHVGAVITPDKLKLRGMWGSTTIPRSALLGVRSDTNKMGKVRRVLLGATEARYEVVVDTVDGPRRLAGLGLAFVSEYGADQFVHRVDDALSAQV